jgi:hypothetical protein
MGLRGSGSTVPMNKRTSVAVTAHAVMEPMIENVAQLNPQGKMIANRGNDTVRA